MLKKITHITDPEHGWIKVQDKDLERVLTQDQILTLTRFSYFDGNIYYLEEDQDAGVYIKALKDKGHQVEIITEHTDTRSFVRNLPKLTTVKNS